MADFSLFKNKMSVMRFRAEEPTKISADELREGLITHKFKEEATLPVNYGFVDFVNLYGLDPQFHDRLHVFGNWFVAAVRFDKRNVPASAIKREVALRLQQYKETSGVTFIKKAEKADVKAQATAYLLSRVLVQTSFVVFAVDMSNGNGYYYATSKKSFEQFEELFERAYGVSFKPIAPETGNDFLTYLWWESESNSFAEMPLNGKLTKTFVGDRVSVSEEDKQKITVSGDIEEAKLSVSKGADVTKIELLVQIGEDERKFVVDSDGKLSSLTFEASMLPDRESEELTPFIAATEDVFGLLDLWKDKYVVAQENGSGLTPAIRQTWGRGNYCSKSFEDI